jgi:hypothetical protein
VCNSELCVRRVRLSLDSCSHLWSCRALGRVGACLARKGGAVRGYPLVFEDGFLSACFWLAGFLTASFLAAGLWLSAGGGLSSGVMSDISGVSGLSCPAVSAGAVSSSACPKKEPSSSAASSRPTVAILALRGLAGGADGGGVDAGGVDGGAADAGASAAWGAASTGVCKRAGGGAGLCCRIRAIRSASRARRWGAVSFGSGCVAMVHRSVSDGALRSVFNAALIRATTPSGFNCIFLAPFVTLALLLQGLGQSDTQARRTR